MPTIRELSTWVRNYGQDARHLPHLLADKFVWHQLWVAMDVIDDVDLALTAYLENDFPEQTGEKYLRIYGAMQGLFLQQDALRHLASAIHPAKVIRPNDVLTEIREARNASVGHSTAMKRNGVLSTHGIVQNSVRKDGFTLLSYPPKDGTNLQDIPVQELIEKQRIEIIRILSEIVGDLRRQEEEHRAQFRTVKLVGAFNLVGYAFEKIFEEIRRDVNRLSPWAVGELSKSRDEFRTLLEDRGLGIDSYDSVEHLCQRIEHPLAELRKFVRSEPSEISSNATAVVFAEALQSYFDQLRDIAREIDENYAALPEATVPSERRDADAAVSRAASTGAASG